MRTIEIGGLRHPLDRVILGMAAPAADLPAIYDRWVELGGTAIDSARRYVQEPALGDWLAASGLRDRLVVITKACHPIPDDGPPRVTPEAIAADVATSLDHLRSDRIDLLLLHRDDPTVPVGELLGALEAERVAGRIDAYGASNWTTTRLDEASAWAAAHGIPGFAAGSPNLSLAAPVVPPWPGCISAGPDDLAWYERTRLPLLAWSSLGRGYISDDPTSVEADVLAAFDSPDNRRRRDRACALAHRLGVSPAAVALAWVLAHPFPTAALVGCRSTAEVEDTLAAERLQVPADELGALAA